MNILLINHYAGSPEIGMEFRPFYMAREWQKKGHIVIILAADYSHIRVKNPKISKDFSEETIEGVKYVWVKTSKYGGNGAKRVLNIFDFVRKLYFHSSAIVKKYRPDVVIASSTYTADNYVARKIAEKAKAKYIYEVHDLWPLSPIELGGMSRKHPFILLMQHAEDYAYKKADLVVSMLPKTLEYMKSRGLNPTKWHYIPNGFDKTQWSSPALLNDQTQGIIDQIKKNFKYILAYTGTLGLANGLDTLVDAAKKCPKNIAIVLMGEGPEKTRIKNRVDKEKIKQCFVLDSITKNEIPSFLNQMDFLYIGLKSEPLFRFGISPNKMIDYMMASKPIIQAIEAGNNMVDEANCGVSIQPENSDQIIEALSMLTEVSTDILQEMGSNGRDFAMKHHDYQKLAAQFLSIME